MRKIIVHDIVLPIKPLTNRELEEAVERLGIPGFLGVFMRDTLPSAPQRIECGILNHDSQDGPGTHWTCWFKHGKVKYYFDSYGLPPPAEMVSYLQPDIRYSTDELQQRGSVVCGHFCLFVLKLLVLGTSLEDAIFSLYK